MIIKDSFRLVSGAPNIFNVSESVVKAHQIEENNPRNVFTFLEQRKKSIKHFTVPVIFDLITNIKKREIIQVVNIDSYPLPVSYNKPTDGLIINLKPIQVQEIASMSPNDLYALLVYSYCFRQLVTKKNKISESYIKTIINYLLSFFVQLFGKEYGLVGIYSTGIPKLKFLIACYVLGSFFGYKTDKNMFVKASSVAPYMYSNEYDQLVKYDFYYIEQFINALSDLKVMPGFSITKLTSKVFRFFGVNMLAALEDCSRFFSVILTSTIPGSRIVPRFLFKYNEKEYYNIIEITKGLFK